LAFSFVSYEAKVLLVLHGLDPTLVFEAQLLFFIAVNFLDPTLVFEAQLLFFIAVNVFVSSVQLFNGL
jgi:hypothetical protein